MLDKRAYISKMYPGPAWKLKVQKMSDNQVTAIYLKMISSGQKPVKNSVSRSDGRQLNLFRDFGLKQEV